MTKRPGPIHLINRIGYATACERDPARCRWTSDAAKVTCQPCRSMGGLDEGEKA